jgi:SH3 domain-containing YSC84-like protein 1
VHRSTNFALSGFFSRSLVLIGIALLATVAAGVIAAASTRSDTLACLDNATKVLRQIAPDPPNGIPEEVTEAAKCVAVLPHLLKDRFGLTATHGKGVVTCRNLEGWSAPAFFTLSDGLWLPRARVTDTSLIAMVTGQEARQLLSTKKIEIGTDVSAIGGPIGRHVSPEDYDRLNRQILTYSISKGHFGRISLDGAIIQEDRRSIVAIYGRAAVMQAVLNGRFPVPPVARPFLAVVNGIVQRKSIR